MDDDKDGGQAFPRAISADAKNSLNHGMPGMTLRDYFAGQALGSIPLRNWSQIGDDQLTINAWASCAYRIADAMIAERSRTDG